MIEVKIGLPRQIDTGKMRAVLGPAITTGHQIGWCGTKEPNGRRQTVAVETVLKQVRDMLVQDGWEQETAEKLVIIVHNRAVDEGLNLRREQDRTGLFKDFT